MNDADADAEQMSRWADADADSFFSTISTINIATGETSQAITS